VFGTHRSYKKSKTEDNYIMNVKFCSFDNEIQTENPLVIADSYNECVRETLKIGEFTDETLEDMVTTPNIEEVMGFSVKQMLVQG